MLNLKYFCLAVPGLLSGLVLTLISRKAKSDLALPYVMVAFPVTFYITIYVTGVGVNGARSGGGA